MTTQSKIKKEQIEEERKQKSSELIMWVIKNMEDYFLHNSFRGTSSELICVRCKERIKKDGTCFGKVNHLDEKHGFNIMEKFEKEVNND